MSHSAAIPSLLPSNQFDHFYRGGNRIGALRHGPGGPMRPEEWIASVTTRFGEAETGLSRLADGTLLKDAIASDPDSWLGARHQGHFGLSTEILIKLLDLDQRLPVHFHPNKKFAQQHLGLDHGKTEAWIILEAPVGSKVGLGFKDKQDKANILELVTAQDSTALLAALRTVEVQAGDAFLVPAGVAHAIDAGIFLLELQEPTDLSALLEWEGFAVDGIVDGHLGLGFETVTDALQLDPLSDDDFNSLIVKNSLTGGEQRTLLPLKADGYFRTDLLPGTGSVAAGFAVVLILDGTGAIAFESAPSLTLTPGDAIVIPHSAGNYSIQDCVAIVCRPPLAELAALAP